ncbi:hypothetical protein RHSIM_Rhsim03G0060500 [Rhododendron simsii]|uniref:Ankyrin repeat family protein n=1 Tax=Rhododendron simsii TaxID=118357 RepID=A0A834H9K5_RHOSS|nr:hypothetical protein RHSIM_Rhsim03G0060800 [Rhododendron simsii]KAF7148056.1 hypothetical protein RHSIM_Rhsim03G0060500 [Rhododendron simsii]
MKYIELKEGEISDEEPGDFDDLEESASLSVAFWFHLSFCLGVARCKCFDRGQWWSSGLEPFGCSVMVSAGFVGCLDLGCLVFRGSVVLEKVQLNSSSISDMYGTEEAAKRLYEACLSGSVETLKALIEKDPLIPDQASLTECFSSDTPLHVAALRGHLEFTKDLLSRKPTLAAELDS